MRTDRRVSFGGDRGKGGKGMISYLPICARGFRCPYYAYGEDGTPICIYPYHPLNPDIEDEEFGLIEEMCYLDCHLMNPDGELMEILLKVAEEKDKESQSGLYG